MARMTPEQWRRIQALLDQALALDESQREAYLDHACGDDDPLRREVCSLIEADRTETTPLDRPALQLLTASASPAEHHGTPPPTRLGPYRLLEALDRGGMGEVFLAERDDASYQQHVAIKILHAGILRPETVQRFRSERQILAALDHPNIAKLLDGGSTDDGRPYLVMELVEGRAIDDHCQRQGLGIRARLHLFAKVCQAVQFAHQNLVVHRDLKPANILISPDGEPTLLDFGIAKLLSPEAFPQTVLDTATGFMPMTPQYASPEQVRGDAITTATDVYALGVLLYQLLAGRPPYTVDRNRPQASLQAICEVVPPRPSSTVFGNDPEAVTTTPGGDSPAWRRTLAGDLDSIVLKALRKQPKDRYASAAELEQDIGHYLRGRPVTARDGTWPYRARKFIARNRLALGIAGTVLLGTIAFVAALILQRAEILAQQARSEQVSGFMTGVFAMPDPTRVMAESITVRELLDRGARQIELELEDQPDVQGDLMATIGQTYRNLGLFEEAQHYLERSLALRAQSRNRKGSLARAESLHLLASLAVARGHYADAERWGREALTLHRQWLGSRHRDVVGDLLILGRAHDLAGDPDAAAVELTEALTIASILDDRAPLATVLDRLAQLRMIQGRHDEAEALFEEARDVHHAVYGPHHPTVALTLNNFATLLDRIGDFARAEALLLEAEAIQRSRYDGHHHHLATTLHNLGFQSERRERLDQAQRYYDEALVMRKAIYRGPHRKIASTVRRLGNVARSRGDHETAGRLLNESMDMFELVLGDDHPELADTFDLYAQLLVDRGALDEAEDYYHRALRIRRDARGENHSSVAINLANLADLSRKRRAFDKAAELYQDAIGRGEAALGTDHVDVARFRCDLGSVQRSLAQRDAAADHLRRAVRDLRNTLGDAHGDVAQCLLIQAMVEIDRGNPEVADALARDAQAVYQRGNDDPKHAANAAGVLGKSLFAQQRYADAEPQLLASYRYYRDTRGPGSRPTRIRLDQLVSLYEAWGKVDQAETYRALRSADDG